MNAALRVKIWIVPLLLFLLLSACSSTPVAPPQENSTTSSFTTPALTEEVISWQEAGDHIGRYRRVEGNVVLTHYARESRGQPTFLDFHDPYQDYFSCIIWGDDRSNFPPKPEERFLNKRVRVRGVIKSYKGAPEMILYYPSQIQVANPDGSWPGFPEYEITTALVTSVIDGDTIEIEGGQRVRYIGIDTPETAGPYTSAECFGKKATAKNRELVGGKEVRLVRDIENKDKYGRLLRYVYVDELMVNAELVRLGYAEALFYQPNVKYKRMFSELEQKAKAGDLGLWGKCR